MALIITDENFEELIGENKSVVVDFWAEWCGPCRMISPIIEELADKYAEKAIIGKMNIDENNKIPDEYAIRSIPTVLFFKNGELADKHIGFVSKYLLEEKLKTVL